MSRNLKALGLALVAALVLGAIGAQGASAVTEHSFRSGANNTVLTGQNEAGNIHTFTATAGLNIECTTATFEGTNVGTTVDTVTAHPKYSGCSFFGEAATIDTNGCNYIFDSDTTTSTHSGGAEHAAVSINSYFRPPRPGFDRLSGYAQFGSALGLSQSRT